jgi:cell shape-determining protein MreD
MRSLLFAIIGFILLVLENLLRVSAPIWNTAPQLTFLLILFFGFTGHPIRSVLFSFLLGLMIDSICGNVPGLFAISYVLSASVVVALRRYFYLRSAVYEILTVLMMTAFAGLVRIGFLLIFSLAKNLRISMLAAMPGQMLLNLSAGLLLFPILFRIDNLIESREKEPTFTSRSW